MEVDIKKLDDLYTEFKSFIKKTTGEDFKTFKSSRYVEDEENYKYNVYKEARISLGRKKWNLGDIGTGKIQKSVSAAFKNSDNNLLDWRKQDKFSQRPIDKLLEKSLYDFYNSKDQAYYNQSFNQFVDAGLDYQLIAFLFFIKEPGQFLPISQEKFDQIFVLIGITGFKTSHNVSWENYRLYCDIIREVRKFLKEQKTEPELLDAHSFLWILGNQMQLKVKPIKSPSKIQPPVQQDDDIADINIEQEVVNPEPVIPPLPDNQLHVHQDDTVTTVKTKEGIENIFPDELPFAIAEELFEGAKLSIVVNVYERNTEARKQCIEYWKAICAVCNFDFEQIYGERGKGFIHVHHITPISQNGESHDIDPIKDLIPLCPNCHAMVHRYEPLLSIEELKEIIANQSN